LQPSLFTRLAAAEVELRSVKDTLAEVLDVLAELKATQDAMREGEAERRRAEPLLTGRQRPWWRVDDAVSILGRALLPIREKLNRIRILNAAALDGFYNDDLVFWRDMARISITGLFLLTIFMIGLYQLFSSG
jgi:hypothetical protein